MSKFKAKNFPESMNYALQGLVYAFRTQRNLRVHVSMSVLVLLLAVTLRVSNLEMAVLALTIGMVIACEMANTALEAVVDLVTNQYHPLAAIAKNVAAGAVLVASAVAITVGYFVFFTKLASLHPWVLAHTAVAPPLITFMAILVVLVVVLSLKVTGGPIRFQGGMPSAHTAAATALATAIFFLSYSGMATVLGFCMAFIVAQARVEARIHSLAEVLVGGLIGLLLTVLVFQLL